jgi:hypothetical protein
MNIRNRIGAALLAATAALGLSGCVTDDYGYGYGGVSLGYSDGYYGGYYGAPYYGWYDNYYYPGTGYYSYDRGGGRHTWTDSQRRYWESRRGDRQAGENWSGYRGGQTGGTGQSWQQRREAWRAQNQGLSPEARQQQREAWQAQHQQQGASGQNWQERREAWRAQNQGLSPDARQQQREAWQAQHQQQSATSQNGQQHREAWHAQNQAQGQTQSGSGWQGRGNRGGREGWRRGD